MRFLCLLNQIKHNQREKSYKFKSFHVYWNRFQTQKSSTIFWSRGIADHIEFILDEEIRMISILLWKLIIIGCTTLWLLNFWNSANIRWKPGQNQRVYTTFDPWKMVAIQMIALTISNALNSEQRFCVVSGKWTFHLNLIRTMENRNLVIEYEVFHQVSWKW